MANSFSWVKRDSSPLRDPQFCRLDWTVRGLYDALYMLAIDLVQTRGGSVSDALGTAEDIAWHLRAEIEFIEWSLGQLEAVGYVAQVDGQWTIARAAEEQQPTPMAERVGELRKRQKASRNEVVTKRYNGSNETLPDKDKDSDKDLDRDTDRDAGAAAAVPASSNIFKLYEQNIGALTPMMGETLKEAEQTYPLEWIADAFGEAVAHNARNWRYVEAILKRWQAQGRGPVTQGGARAPAQGGRSSYNTSELDALIGKGGVL